ALVRILVEAHRIEDEELGFWATVRRRRDAAHLQILFRLEGNEARIARIRLTRDGIVDVADHRKRGHLEHWVDENSRRIGDEEHVALVDCLKSPDRGAIEAE